MKDKKESSKKEHANFQDKYRKSSNFPSLTANEADFLRPVGDGKLKIKNSESDEE